jgi:hypothetical protein
MPRPRRKLRRTTIAPKALRYRRFGWQYALVKKLLQVYVRVSHITIKAISTVAFISVLPKKNVTWEFNTRVHDIHIPVQRPATTAYPPPGNPRTERSYTLLIRRKYCLPS